MKASISLSVGQVWESQAGFRVMVKHVGDDAYVTLIRARSGRVFAVLKTTLQRNYVLLSETHADAE